MSFGVRFSTYATFWAKAAVRHALQEQSRVVRLPSRVHHTFSKIKRATNTLQAQGTHHEVTDDQISMQLAAGGVQLSPQRIRQVIEHVKVRPTSLDARLGSGTEGGSVIDLIIDDSTRIEANVVQSMLRQDLRTLMSRYLRPQEARVLILRFGLDDGVTRTIRQVAEAADIPYATAKHVLFLALSKMRKPHVALALREYLTDPST